MAACTRGMGDEARVALTLAMRDSGDVLKWGLPAPTIDKHSTGGIGDCVSLILAPMLAAAGAFVPMISGRGLGHTGGTLDKLEAIPGVSTDVDEATFRKITRDVGCAIVSASTDIAPADRRLYAIRDVTATVESVDLITASILSKKLAASADALVLDVKLGSGAFMKDAAAAQALARALTETANASGCRTRALVTDMHQPLAPAVGNALEVAEVMRALTGDGTGPLCEVTAALGGAVLADAGLAKSDVEGTARIAEVITDGRAAERFGRMIAAMGGPLAFADNWARFLPEANVIREVGATEAGYVSDIDGEALGLAVVALGGGRKVESDRIDPAVGLARLLPLGTKVSAGTPLVAVHAAREDTARAAEAAVRAAIRIAPNAPEARPLVHDRIGP